VAGTHGCATAAKGALHFHLVQAFPCRPKIWRPRASVPYSRFRRQSVRVLAACHPRARECAWRCGLNCGYLASADARCGMGRSGGWPWFLDGFSPRQNPDCGSRTCCMMLAASPHHFGPLGGPILPPVRYAEHWESGASRWKHDPARRNGKYTAPARNEAWQPRAARRPQSNNIRLHHPDG